MLALTTRPAVRDWVTITTSDHLSTLIAMVLGASEPDAPLDLRSAYGLRWINDLLSALWRREEIDWSYHNLEPELMDSLVANLWQNEQLHSLFHGLEAHAITVPDLTGTLIFHFPEPKRSF